MATTKVTRDETATFKTVQEAAEYLRMQFENREDKPNQRFLKETAQAWCVDAVRDSNNSNLNLDLCYELTEEGADWIADLGEVDDSGDLFDHDYPEGDSYITDCMAWLASDIDHVELVNEQIKDNGATDIVTAIQMAQSEQKRAVFAALWDWLKENVVDDEDDAQGDEDDDEG